MWIRGWKHENYNQCIYYIDILNAIDRQQQHYHNMLNQAMTQVNQVSNTGFIAVHGLNEGHIAHVYAVNDHWLHTFELIVPRARVPKRHNILSCESEDEGHGNYNQCTYYIDILNAMDRQQQHYHNLLNQAMTQVNQVSNTGFITLHGLNEGHIHMCYYEWPLVAHIWINCTSG